MCRYFKQFKKYFFNKLLKFNTITLFHYVPQESIKSLISLDQQFLPNYLKDIEKNKSLLHDTKSDSLGDIRKMTNYFDFQYGNHRTIIKTILFPLIRVKIINANSYY